MKELEQAIRWRSRGKRWKPLAIPMLLLLGIALLCMANFPQVQEALGMTGVPEKAATEEMQEETQAVPKGQETPGITEETQALPKGQAHPSTSKGSASLAQKDAPAENTAVQNNPAASSFGEPSSPAVSIPRQEAPAPDAVPGGPIETDFSVNGAALNQAKPEAIPLGRETWGQCHATLHVANRTNVPWDAPSIRIVFSDNWGGKYTETKSLPSLAPGESAAFPIPVGSYPVTDRPQVSAWLQVYLDTGSLSSTESYWCVQFDLNEEEAAAYPQP